MNDLKIRAWHRKEQQIYTPEELQEKGYVLDVNGKGFMKYNTDGSGGVQYFSTMLPLFYSHQKDKHGKEIYEADILRHEGHVYQVLWYDSGIWMIREDGKPVDLATASAEVEVIGDLYTHPERINS